MSPRVTQQARQHMERIGQDNRKRDHALDQLYEHQDTCGTCKGLDRNRVSSVGCGIGRKLAQFADEAIKKTLRR